MSGDEIRHALNAIFLATIERVTLKKPVTRDIVGPLSVSSRAANYINISYKPHKR